jgi:lysozyme family protein
MTFEAAVDFILSVEGGYSFDANDPGGETNFGISKRRYPSLDIKNLTRAEAITLYFQDFWQPLKPLLLPERLRLCLFDCAVNQGLDRAVKTLQLAVGVKQDGVLGPLTLAALKNKNDIETFAVIMQARLQVYTKLPHWDSFGKGWAKRLLQVTIASLR